MRVLVTGAAGMIGRKLTVRLVDDGTIAGRRLPRSICTTSCRQTAEVNGIAVTTSASDLAARAKRKSLLPRDRM